MRKQIKYWLIVLLAGLAITILNSCSSNTVEISKEEYQKLKGDTIKPKYPKPFKLYEDVLTNQNPDGIVLGSDGHEYLVTNYNSNSKNVEHYIDCEKCLLRNKKDSL